ncbi:hypothetical protein Pr1d_42490 [Bythopirellula goksoeyrii]|uniref:Uncharacterized protein n=2 Tax=Bythopirellula goksoeyrii TaxID=1400387 RepID=A0A5B9QG80_9BACT|nr:hypothetical protein Pr1d_42490 [Bythopirellula goksoeyrii]
MLQFRLHSGVFSYPLPDRPGNLGNTMKRLLVVYAIALCCSGSLQGQTLPSGVLDVPPLVIGNSESIGSNTTLNVANGGIVGNLFDAGKTNGTSTNIEVNVIGGVVGDGFDAYGGSTVNISGGSVGEDFDAHRNSVVNISGGNVGQDFRALYESEVNITGGSVGRRLLVYGGGTVNLMGGSIGDRSEAPGGTLNISGGTVGYQFLGGEGSVVNISGGELGESSYAFYLSTFNISGGLVKRNFSVVNSSTVNVSGGVIESGFYVSSLSPAHFSGGSIADGFEKSAGSLLTIEGADYSVDGVPIQDLVEVGSSLQYDLPAGAVLSGTFADGTPFAFSSLEGDDIADGTIVLNTVAIPTPDPITIEMPGGVLPLGIRMGQTLNVSAGGIVPSNFNAGPGSHVNISGGEVWANFESTGAIVEMSEGVLGSGFDAFHGSSVAIAGGVVGGGAHFLGADLVVTGGRMGDNLFVGDGSTANFSGGTFENRLNLNDGSSTTFQGADFRIDGVPVAGLDQIDDTVAISLPTSAVLSGTLADGTPFAFSRLDGDLIADGVLTLQAAAVTPIGPTSIDAESDPLPLGIRTGQTLTVGVGANVPAAFNAGRGSHIDVTGGTIGTNLEAVSAEVSISSGDVGDYFDAFDGSVVTMTGGELGYGGQIDNGSVLNLSGGVIRGLTATHGTTINVSGGEIFGTAAVRDNATITLVGGTVVGITAANSVVDVAGGEVGSFTAGVGSMVTLRGGRFGDGISSSASSSVLVQGAEFHLDGIPLAGVAAPGDLLAVNIPLGSVVSGTLSDGTTFAFGKGFRTSDSFADGSLTLEFVEPPPAGPTIITLPTDPVPLGVRNGQTLIVESGGVVGENFTAAVGSQIVVHSGGVIGANFEAIGSEVLVYGGTIGSRLDILAGATLTMTSGVLGAGSNSAESVNVFGGTLNLRGGAVEPALIAADEAEVNLFGYGFAINGVPIVGLAQDEAFPIFDRNGASLTGYLSDGSPFDFRLLESSGRIFDAFSADTLLTVTLTVPDELGGDFDMDGDVDGRDFLEWQRNGSPDPLSSTDLALWQTQYGLTATPGSATRLVPEPSSLIQGLMILVGGLNHLCRRK